MKSLEKLIRAVEMQLGACDGWRELLQESRRELNEVKKRELMDEHTVRGIDERRMASDNRIPAGAGARSCDPGSAGDHAQPETD